MNENATTRTRHWPDDGLPLRTGDTGRLRSIHPAAVLASLMFRR
jgi:hypothetical protein